MGAICSNMPRTCAVPPRSCIPCSSMGVRIGPGWMELTRMLFLRCAHSSAIDLVMSRTAPLLEL